MRRTPHSQGRSQRYRTAGPRSLYRRIVLPARRPIWSNSATFWRIRKLPTTTNSWPTPCCSTRRSPPKANCRPARTPARPSASARRARMSLRERTTPNVSPGASTKTYKERNLRYSQVVPFTMTEEKNSGTNLPAQIDLYADNTATNTNSCSSPRAAAPPTRPSSTSRPKRC